VVNLAFVYVLPMSELAGEKFAAGAVAKKIFGAYGDSTIRVLAILSLLSTINAYTLTAPRILYAMSCDELFTHHATRVNKGGTPTVTLLISTVVAMLFISFRSFEQVLAALAFFFVANYTMAYISVIILRQREPDLPRPYRAWGYPWTTLIVLLGSIAFLVGAVLSDKQNSLWALGILAVSYPLYLLVRLISPGGSETGN
jgi:APA family basic amino acid/polyamine antiporter